MCAASSALGEQVCSWLLALSWTPGTTAGLQIHIDPVDHLAQSQVARCFLHPVGQCPVCMRSFVITIRQAIAGHTDHTSLRACCNEDCVSSRCGARWLRIRCGSSLLARIRIDKLPGRRNSFIPVQATLENI